MSRLRFPICYWSAILSVLAYLTCSTVAYLRFPLAFSPANNWLSDLGNPVDNPGGAPLYNMGVALTAVFIAAWFVGLSQWRLSNHVANQRLLTVCQTIGLLSCVALVLSALNPINVLPVHAFWSQVYYLGSGIAFAFSVAALRYHPRATAGILYLGAIGAVWPSATLMLGRGVAYWMEWVTVCLFILYLLLLGSASRQFRGRVNP